MDKRYKAPAVGKSYHSHLVNHMAWATKIAWFQFSPGLPNWNTWTLVTWLKSQKVHLFLITTWPVPSPMPSVPFQISQPSGKQLQDAYWHVGPTLLANIVGSKWREKCWKYCSKSFLFKRRPKSFRLARAPLWQSGPCSPRSGTNKHIYLPYITYISPTRN